MKPEDTGEFKATYGDLTRTIRRIAHRHGIASARTTARIQVSQRMAKIVESVDKLLGELTCLRDANVSIEADLSDSVKDLRQRFGAVNKVIAESAQTHNDALRGGFDALDPIHNSTNSYKRVA